MNNTRFKVSISAMYLTSEQLGKVCDAVQGLDLLEESYVGVDKGEFGTAYKYGLRRGQATDQVRIIPMPEAVTLYFNTFGKEETK